MIIKNIGGVQTSIMFHANMIARAISCNPTHVVLFDTPLISSFFFSVKRDIILSVAMPYNKNLYEIAHLILLKEN
ncbi:hypothetical protein ACJX0J_032477, partial [Zea mays]